VVLCLLAIPVHLWLHELSATPVISLLALAWLPLLAWALARPATLERCADWADRHLGGQSAFSTALEMETATSPVHPDALTHLHRGRGQRIEQARLTLQATPSRMHAGRSAVIALAASAMLAIVLQAPGRVDAPGRDKVATQGTDAAPQLRAADEGRDAGLAEALRAATREDEPRPESSGGLAASRAADRQARESIEPPAAQQPLTPDPAPGTAAAIADREAPSGLTAATGSANTETSGREAGTARDERAPGRDEEQDATLFAREQGNGIRLDEDSDLMRADSSLSGVYEAGDGGTRAKAAERSPAFPAAEPPRSEPAQELGPAAAAYVTAYLESRTGR
jgi:hypothetical protein